MNADRVGGETDRLHRLSDEAWNSISDLFPHSIGNKGFSQIIPSREVFEAVLYRARTGCPWRDLPKSYGPWHTIYMRWQRWVVRGVPNRVWKMLLEQKVDLGKLDLSLVILDSSVVRAHQHAAGAQKKKVFRHWAVLGEDFPLKFTLPVWMIVMRLLFGLHLVRLAMLQ